MKYIIHRKEITIHAIEVEADTERDAMGKVGDIWDNIESANGTDEYYHDTEVKFEMSNKE